MHTILGGDTTDSAQLLLLGHRRLKREQTVRNRGPGWRGAVAWKEGEGGLHGRPTGSWVGVGMWLGRDTRQQLLLPPPPPLVPTHCCNLPLPLTRSWALTRCVWE